MIVDSCTSVGSTGDDHVTDTVPGRAFTIPLAGLAKAGSTTTGVKVSVPTPDAVKVHTLTRVTGVAPDVSTTRYRNVPVTAASGGSCNRVFASCTVVVMTGVPAGCVGARPVCVMVCGFGIASVPSVVRAPVPVSTRSNCPATFCPFVIPA